MSLHVLDPQGGRSHRQGGSERRAAGRSQRQVATGTTGRPQVACDSRSHRVCDSLSHREESGGAEGRTHEARGRRGRRTFLNCFTSPSSERVPSGKRRTDLRRPRDRHRLACIHAAYPGVRIRFREGAFMFFGAGVRGRAWGDRRGPCSRRLGS